MEPTSVDSGNLRAHPGDYLTFLLGGETHGVPIGQVVAVLALPTITPVPGLPRFMRGILHHEGSILPTLDLGFRLGMGETTTGKESCVVVVHVPVKGRRLAMAVLVSEVKDVVPFAKEVLTPPPEFGLRVDTRYLLGMARAEDGAITLLLDLNQVLDEEDLDSAARAARKD